MTVVMIGADYVENIARRLGEMGVTHIEHIDGRNRGAVKRLHICPQAACILVFSDYINHNLAKMVKEEGKRLMIPLIYGKRSWCSLEQKLESILPLKKRQLIGK